MYIEDISRESTGEINVSLMKNCPYCGGEYAAYLTKCPNCMAVLTEEKIERENQKREQQRKEAEQEVEMALIREKTRRILTMVGVAIAVFSVIKVVKFQTSLPLSNGMTKTQVENYYQEGVTFLESQQYADAVKAFSNIPEDSKYYKKAEKLYKEAEGLYLEEVTRKAHEYSENGEYETAEKLVEKAMEVVPESTSLASEKSKYLAERNKELVKSTKEKVNEYYSEGDYQNAIKCLRETLSTCEDEELSALLDVASKEYENHVLDSIDELYDESGYDDVVELLVASLKTLPDSKNLQNEYKTWKERCRRKLIVMEPFSCAYVEAGDDPDELTDNYGNRYESCLSVTDKDIVSSGKIEYYLDYKYRVLTGTIYITELARRYDSVDGGESIRILGDGELLYTVSGMDKKTKPIDISIDVSDVEFLAIELREAGSSVVFGNPTVGW